jgi:hypothetical protein
MRIWGAGLFLALVMLLWPAWGSAAQAATIYVNDDAPGANNGTTWNDAYTKLQDALAAAVSGDEIWVAEGVYYPDEGGGMTDNDRTATFQLKNGVRLYGGFNGSETNGSDRSFFANVTILSGDIDQNDTNSDGNHIAETWTDIQGSNAYHVVTGSGTDNTAIFDSFTVTAGKADAAVLPHNEGGGMTNVSGSPTISNMFFKGNHARFGGGMSNRGSSPAIAYVHFINNRADQNGGGMSNGFTASPTIEISFFGGNYAHDGGGMYNQDQGNPTVRNSVFSGNRVAGYGGALTSAISSPTLINVTITRNQADVGGGGLIIDNNSNATLVNTIVWGNQAPTGPQILTQNSTATIRYSLVQGSGGSGLGWNSTLGMDGGNNLDANPFFDTPLGGDNLLGTFDDNPRLLPGSPALDRGDSSANTYHRDQDGRARIQGSAIDIGAYEGTNSCSFIPRLYVNRANSGGANGNSWSEALDNLQDALTLQAACPVIREIWVAKGVYYPDEGGSQTNNDRTASFQLQSNLAIYGGFAGTESNRDQRDPAANLTILSGDIEQNDVNADNNQVAETGNQVQGNNAFHVVTGRNITTTAQLDGFTITAGAGNTSEGGGGLYNENGSPTLTNLIFRGNQAQIGGGLRNNQSNPILTNVIITGNTAIGGGGMANDSSSPTLTNVTFSGNQGNQGGGMANYEGANPTLTNVTFNGNKANENGGGIVNYGSASPTLTNVTLSGNQAGLNGGGIGHGGGTLTLKNVTFFGNQAATGGAIANSTGTVQVTNSIIANSTGSANCSGAITSGGYNLATDTSCNLTAQTDRPPADPKLAPLGEYDGASIQTHDLLEGSPAFDTGNCSNNTVTSDARGVSRPQGQGCDIGAHEDLGVIPYDYGDAPDPSYPTLQASNGARHGLLNNLKLGATVDSEATGQPSANALGDDTAGDDEDGVALPAELFVCQATTVNVTAAAAGRLFAWIDWNDDGDWADANERIVNGAQLAAGVQPITVSVPCGATLTDATFARFRLTSAVKLDATGRGQALDGEVEDYQIALRRGPPEAHNDHARTVEDRAVTVRVLDNDRDSVSALTIDSIARPPSNGTATIESGFLRYTPKANWYGTDSFEYTVANDINRKATATVHVLVTAVNDAPTDVRLSNTRVDALLSLDTPIGTLSVADVDQGDTHSYQLSGPDAASFAIAGTVLRRAAYYNPAKKDRYTVRITSTDAGNAKFEKEFVITIFAAEPIGPRNLRLSNNRVRENLPAGTLVGELTATDPRNLPLTFSLVNGQGDQHSRYFRLEGTQLKTATTLDFETLPSASLRIQVTNGVDDPLQIVMLVKLIDEPNDPPPPFSNCTGQDIRFIQSNDNETEVTIRQIKISELTSEGCVVEGKMYVRIPGNSVAENIAFRGRVDKRNQLQSYDPLVGDKIDEFKLDPAGPIIEINDAIIEYYAGRPSLRIKKPKICLPMELSGICVTVPAVTWLIDSSGMNFGGTSLGNTTTKIPLGSILMSKSGVGISKLYGNYKRVANGYEIVAGGTFGLPRFTSETGCGITVIVTIGKDSTTNAINVQIRPAQAADAPLLAEATNGVRLSELTLGYSCKPGIPIGNTGFYLTEVLGTVSLRPDNEFVRLQLTIATAPLFGPISIAKVKGSATVHITPEWGLDLGAQLKLLSLIEVAHAEARIRKDRFSSRFSFNAFVISGNVGTDIWTTNGTRLHFTGRGTVAIKFAKGRFFEACVPYPTCSKCTKWKIPYPCNCRTAYACAAVPPNEIELGGLGTDFGEFTNSKYGFKGYANFLGKQYGFYVDHSGSLAIGGVSDYVLATPPALAAAALQVMAAQAADEGRMSLDPTLLDERYSFVSDQEVVIQVPDREALIAASTGISVVNVAETSDLLFNLTADPGLSMTLLAPNGLEITPANYNQGPVAPTYGVKYTSMSFHELERAAEVDEAALSRLRFVPASTRADLATVDVLVDGAKLFAGVGLLLPEPSDYVLLTPGDHTVQVMTVGGGMVLSQTVTTAASADYTLVAAGKATADLLLLTDANDTHPPAGQGLVRFVQGAQIGVPVNVLINDVPVLTNADYGAVSDYLALPAGELVVKIQHATTGADVAPQSTLDVEAGLIYTLYATDRDNAGYVADWSLLVDEVYRNRVFTQYSVDGANPGEWRVKLNGNLESNLYMLSVNGLARPTQLTNVTVNASDLSQTQVNWTLNSDFAPAKVTVYLSTEPVTRTATYTEANGQLVSQVEPNYTGFAVGEFTLTSVAEVRSAATTQAVDLSSIPSGQYHLWVRADNDELPPASAFALDPSTGQIARITIDQGATFPTTWNAVITPTLETESLSLAVRWQPLTHPDIDFYRAYLEVPALGSAEVISNIMPTAPRDENFNPVGEMLGLAVFSHLRPDQGYMLVVEAVDEESGRTVRSQAVPISYPAGEYQLTTPQSVYRVAPDSTLLIPLSLQVTQPLFFADVPLGINSTNLPAGILVYFEGELDAPAMLSANTTLASKNLVVEVGATVPEGSYRFTVHGYNADGLERSHTLTLQVGAQILQAQTLCYGKDLGVSIPVQPAASGGFDLVVISGPLPQNLVVSGALTCVPYTGFRSMVELTNQLVTQGCADGAACHAIKRIIFDHDGSYRIETIQEVQTVRDAFLPLVQQWCGAEPLCD